MACSSAAGRVIEHTDGIHRAECCRVLQFLAHTSLAARLSRIYGVPCVITDSSYEAGRKMVSWLGSRDGIRCLQWNLQLAADLGAGRLLSSVDSLHDELRQAAVSDDVPEAEKDRGGWISEYIDAESLQYRDGVLVINNNSLKPNYPDGVSGFTYKYLCRYNNELTILIRQDSEIINTAIRDLEHHGLIVGKDFVMLHNSGDSIVFSIDDLFNCSSWLRVGNGIKKSRK